MKAQLIVPAAGQGERLGAATPKALVPLAGAPLLIHTVSAFIPLDLANGTIVVVTPELRNAFVSAVQSAFPEQNIRIVDGGRERQDSVRNGLAALDDDTEIAVIHDAARPFVSTGAIAASIEAAAEFGAATVAIPCVDTILRGDGDAFLQETPDRSTLWACQTPQTFRVAVIREAHREAHERGFAVTDDATIVRATGASVKLVRGSRENIKITTPEDLAYAEFLLAKHNQEA